MEKRPSGCSQNETANRSEILPLEALKDRAVLAVDGEKADTVVPDLFHYQLAGHDERLLVSKGDIFPRLDGPECWLEPGKPHQGTNDHVHIRVGYRLPETFGPRQYLHWF